MSPFNSQFSDDLSLDPSDQPSSFTVPDQKQTPQTSVAPNADDWIQSLHPSALSLDHPVAVSPGLTEFGALDDGFEMKPSSFMLDQPSSFTVPDQKQTPQTSVAPNTDDWMSFVDGLSYRFENRSWPNATDRAKLLRSNDRDRNYVRQIYDVIFECRGVQKEVAKALGRKHCGSLHKVLKRTGLLSLSTLLRNRHGLTSSRASPISRKLRKAKQALPSVAVASPVQDPIAMDISSLEQMEESSLEQLLENQQAFVHRLQRALQNKSATKFATIVLL